VAARCVPARGAFGVRAGDREVRLAGGQVQSLFDGLLLQPHDNPVERIWGALKALSRERPRPQCGPEAG
jgi:hypothetical protein